VTDTVPDIEAVFADLAATHPGRGRYAPLAVYRDFRAVFLGSEQGKRVLYEILSLGHMFASSPALGRFDTNRTFFAEGERNLAIRIFGNVNNEPKDIPDRQVSTDPEGR